MNYIIKLYTIFVQIYQGIHKSNTYIPFKAFVTVFVALCFYLECQFTSGSQNQHSRATSLVSGSERATRQRFLHDPFLTCTGYTQIMKKKKLIKKKSQYSHLQLEYKRHFMCRKMTNMSLINISVGVLTQAAGPCELIREEDRRGSSQCQSVQCQSNPGHSEL